MDTLRELQDRLKGRVVILGIGNTLRGDDAIGSLLAARLKGRVPYIVYDAGASPENYLGKIVKDAPDTVVIIDSADFGAKAGEVRVLTGPEVTTTNLFSTHNASISLSINYLKNNLRADIIILMIQPESIGLVDKLSRRAQEALDLLEGWFSRLANNVES
ncbi:MAG: hydrogenase maturation protease [Candidatus Omnitrophica bacterium]|nr:hydrogenase maturation protease [Candidatus Omnitrophota bacterium]